MASKGLAGACFCKCGKERTYALVFRICGKQRSYRRNGLAVTGQSGLAVMERKGHDLYYHNFTVLSTKPQEWERIFW